MAVKGVIVAAGYGSRFWPITRTIPKEMLPVGTRPALDYIVQEFVDAGIEDVLIITSRRKKVMDDWFDRQPELDARKPGDPRLDPPALRVSFVRQQEMRGTGHALLLARTFAGEDPVVLAFPDDLFVDANCSAQLIEAHEATGCSVLCVQDFAGQDVRRYGVVAPKERADGVIGVRELIEKPENPPSTLVSLGRYLYTPEIFAELARGLAAHESGEFYPMDAVNTLAALDRVVAVDVEGTRLDTGEPLGYLKAVIDRALADDTLAAQLKPWLQKRLQ